MAHFSVIIPTYNKSDSLLRTIEGVIQQNFGDWEMLIIDDGSTDRTEDLIQRYLDYPKIRYIKQENQGVSQARNAGIKIAKGAFITFLDADDDVTKNWLGDFNELLKASSNPGYLSCGYFINHDPKSPKLDLNISAKRFSSLAGAFAIKSEVLNEIGGYDTNLKQSENWELTARALHYCRMHGLDVLHTNNRNFTYNHSPNPEQTLIRDENRADATYYLYEKYKSSGVFQYRKDNFLVSSGVNFVRAGKIKKGRKIFYKIFFEKPSFESLSRIIIFEIPPLRKRKWGRK